MAFSLVSACPGRLQLMVFEVPLCSPALHTSSLLPFLSYGHQALALNMKTEALQRLHNQLSQLSKFRSP